MSVCKNLRDSVNTAVATDARLCSTMLRFSAPLRTTKCNYEQEQLKRLPRLQHNNF